MNNLNLLQRKLVYLGGIIVLLVPVLLLGRPGRAALEATDDRPEVKAQEGGFLSQMRTEHDLGDVALGAVDPSSATMNLVLLGLRGVATNLLWMDMKEQQEHKNWTELERTAESIILLQPHFKKVWQFQGWNMAYNVSVEWDAVEDRYFWVKKGIKFQQRGTRRNQTEPELYWFTGDLYGKKIGRADEWVQFRRFFRKDPDPRYEKTNWLDREVNPEGEDNYKVAKKWFQLSKDVDDQDTTDRQHIMANSIYRSYPARAQMDYAIVFGREGSFSEKAGEAWGEAFEDWRTYGLEPIRTKIGEIHMEIGLANNSQGEFAELAAQLDASEEEVRNMVDVFQNMTNYRYWRTRALAEREADTVEAHRLIYAGEQKYKAAEYDEAEKLLLDGMRKFEKMLSDHPVLVVDDLTVEEGLIAILLYRDIRQLQQEPVDIHPLKKLWNNNQSRLPVVQRELERRKNR